MHGEQDITGAEDTHCARLPRGVASSAPSNELGGKLEALFEQARELFGEHPRWRSQLEQLRVHGPQAGDALYVAIVGITSSGKSTLVNALMGGSLLPEESRPTSNLEIRARRGKRDEVRVYYLDGREERLKGGAEALRRRVAQLASEELNPGNEKGVQFIEWSSRRSALPEGIVLLDTPGLDAYGHQEHADLTLTRILPLADIVIYLTSIRNPLKRADLDGLDRIIAHDQRLVVALNQIDLEVDSHEHGQLVRSAQEKLRRHEARLRSDLELRPKLRTFARPVLISARVGKKARGRSQHPAWRSSGLAGLQALLARFGDKLETLPVAARARRLDARLREIASDITKALKDVETPDGADQAVDGASDDLVRVQKLRQGLTRRRKKLDRELGKRSSADTLASHYCARVRKNMSAKQFRAALKDVKEFDSDLFVKLAEATGELQQQAAGDMTELGLRPARRATAKRRLKPNAKLDARDFLTTKSKRVKTRGWFDSIAFWPKYEQRVVTKIDVKAAHRQLRERASLTSGMVADHLDWWGDHFDSLYLKPLREEEARLRERVGMQEALRQQALEQGQALKQLRRRSRNLARRAGAVARVADAALEDVATDDPAGAPFGLDEAAEAASPEECEDDFLGAVLDFFWQHCPADAERSRVLLLGARREPRLRFLSLLTGDLRTFDELVAAAADGWVTLCAEDAEDAPRGHLVRRVPQLPSGVSVTVAPADDASAHLVRHLDDYDLVGVDIDAPRIGAGLSDLARAPYVEALAERVERMFFFSGDGALMRGRFAHLLSQIPDALAKTPWRDVPWLMHEDYDLRYGELMHLGRRCLEVGDSERTFLRRWREQEISKEEPFSRQILARSYVEALNQERKRAR